MALGLAAHPASAGTFFYCVIQDYNGRETRFVSDLREADVEKIDRTYTGFAYSDEIAPLWNRHFPGNSSRSSYCSSSTNRAYIEKERAQLFAQNPDARLVPFTKSPVASKPTRPETGLVLTTRTTKPSVGTKESSTKPPVSAADAERARIAERERREAEFQAKLAAHGAQVAEHQRKVKSREEEIARQQREHAAAQEAAAREKVAHARLIEEHMKRQMEYEAARNRHSLCVNGNQQACAEIAAGKSPIKAELADAGEASTDTDANRCVTTAEVRSNATFQGNTSASVMNGCGQKVDVRICLMRTGGWNCGTVWGVDPQARASHSSFHATGEVFVDARVSTSKRPLASPEGS